MDLLSLVELDLDVELEGHNTIQQQQRDTDNQQQGARHSGFKNELTSQEIAYDIELSTLHCGVDV